MNLNNNYKSSCTDNCIKYHHIFFLYLQKNYCNVHDLQFCSIVGTIYCNYWSCKCTKVAFGSNSWCWVNFGPTQILQKCSTMCWHLQIQVSIKNGPPNMYDTLPGSIYWLKSLKENLILQVISESPSTSTSHTLGGRIYRETSVADRSTYILRRVLSHSNVIISSWICEKEKKNVRSPS